MPNQHAVWYILTRHQTNALPVSNQHLEGQEANEPRESFSRIISFHGPDHHIACLSWDCTWAKSSLHSRARSKKHGKPQYSVSCFENPIRTLLYTPATGELCLPLIFFQSFFPSKFIQTICSFYTKSMNTALGCRSGYGVLGWAWVGPFGLFVCSDTRGLSRASDRWEAICSLLQANGRVAYPDRLTER